MKCKNCGAEIANNSISCPNCGTSTDSVDLNKQGQTESKQGFNSESISGQATNFNQSTSFGSDQTFGSGQAFNQGQPGFSGFNNMPLPNAPDYMLKLLIGIGYLVCCCNWLFGLLGIVFTCMMNSSYKSGNLPEYKAWSKAVTILYIVGIVMYIVLFVAGISLGFLDLFLNELYYW